MQRVIISISAISKSNWLLIYKFIQEFYNDSSTIQTTYNELKKEKWLIDLKVTPAPKKDVYSAYGKDLIESLKMPLEEWLHSFNYIN